MEHVLKFWPLIVGSITLVFWLSKLEAQINAQKEMNKKIEKHLELIDHRVLDILKTVSRLEGVVEKGDS